MGILNLREISIEDIKPCSQCLMYVNYTCLYQNEKTCFPTKKYFKPIIKVKITKTKIAKKENYTFK